jgi:hypothetical protein
VIPERAADGNRQGLPPLPGAPGKGPVEQGKAALNAAARRRANRWPADLKPGQPDPVCPGFPLQLKMQCCFRLKKDAAESLCGPKYRMDHPGGTIRRSANVKVTFRRPCSGRFLLIRIPSAASTRQQGCPAKSCRERSHDRWRSVAGACRAPV